MSPRAATTIRLRPGRCSGRSRSGHVPLPRRLRNRFGGWTRGFAGIGGAVWRAMMRPHGKDRDGHGRGRSAEVRLSAGVQRRREVGFGGLGIPRVHSCAALEPECEASTHAATSTNPQVTGGIVDRTHEALSGRGTGMRDQRCTHGITAGSAFTEQSRDIQSAAGPVLLVCRAPGFPSRLRSRSSCSARLQTDGQVPGW